MTDEEYAELLASRKQTIADEQQCLQLANQIVQYYRGAKNLGNTSAMFGIHDKVHSNDCKPYYLLTGEAQVIEVLDILQKYTNIRRHQLLTPAQLANKLTADKICHPLLIDHYVLSRTIGGLLSIIKRRDSLVKQLHNKLSDISGCEDLCHTVDLLNDKCRRLEEQNAALQTELAKHVAERDKPSLFKRIANVFSTK